MPTDYRRLARAIQDRCAALGWNQEDLIATATLGRTTVQRLWRGDSTIASTRSTLAQMDRTLGWTEGSSRAVLDGGEPTLLSATDGTPQPVQPTATDDPPRHGRSLPVRVRHALETGDIFDADLISIHGLDLILIAKAGAYTGEDVDREVDGNGKSWDLIRELLRNAARESDDPSDQTSDE